MDIHTIRKKGLDPRGHSLLKLIEDFPDNDSWKNSLNGLLDDASDLDKLFIPTRYPNGLPELTPHIVYRAKDARAAMHSSKRVIELVGRLVEV